MKKAIMVVLAVLFAGISLASGQIPNAKAVIELDPVFDSLVSPDAKLEVVKTGFGFTEGTNWVQKGSTGFLIFSDIPANVIDKMTPEGQVSVYLDHSGYDGQIDGYKLLTIGGVSNNAKDTNDPLYREFVMLGSDGLTLDPQGRVVVANYAGRNIYRVKKNGKHTMLAERYQGKRLGGPNDVVVKKDGAIYFTDTFGGLRHGDKDPWKELDSQGIYMIKDGKLTLVISDIKTPNGLAFSPDEKYLYANGSAANFIRRYEVQADDTVTNGQLLIDLTADKAPGITDGMRVDAKGNIFSSGPGGIWVISPDGKHLGTILVPERVANLTFGDADYKTIYIAARTTIYKIRANVTGSHF